MLTVLQVHSYRYTRYHSTTHMYIPVGSAMCSLCYAVGVLCYGYLLYWIPLCTTYLSPVSITHVLLLRATGYIEELLHHPSHVVCIHRGVEDTLVSIMAKEM